jgi:FtsP/CotA-like multicopper oxidase with cupredoxin domain
MTIFLSCRNPNKDPSAKIHQKLNVLSDSRIHLTVNPTPASNLSYFSSAGSVKASMLSSKLFCMALFGAAMGKDVFYDFQLDTKTVNSLSPDCMNVREERRTMFLVNGLFPGPVIEANEGDNITIRVTNRNKASTTSIHFHGIHQKGTPYSDGASFVTQCALGPLQTQEYNFVAYPPGTHYWHEHASYHMVDGITGPLIVRPKDPEPFTYDEERVSYKRQRIHTTTIPISNN